VQLETHIGRYHVQSVVGVGGFGTVVRGRDDELGATVAIKILAEHWAGDVEVRERFLAEARHLRRVRNPHVVSVFDLGELPDGRPWFVMEYADRGSLELRLEGRATGASVDAPSLRRVVTSMADAVGALHAAGVIHRDINPRNVLISSDRAAAGDRDMAAARAAGTTMRRGLLGDDERLLVSDLGLAKDLRLSGNAASVIGGSPHYQAPEQRQQHASIRASADVYALTGVLWHLVLEEVPPDPHAVRDELGEIDARWRDVFATGLATDPDERYATVFEWRDSVLAVLTDGAEMSSPLARPRLPSGTVSDHCPYRGLAAFQPEHAADFFGREVLLGELVERLRYDRTLAVAGPSGSGKSSLVRAGLIPALAGGALTGSAEWPIALMTPGSDPVGELSYQLLRLASRCDGFTPPSLEGRPERAAVRVVADAITDRFGGMVVCIDQFEELFTECPTPEERAAFVDMLAGLVDPTASRCRVVLAMRADFYAQAATSPWLARRISENQVLVGPMDRPELRRAI
jgi:hypothetical protein